MLPTESDAALTVKQAADLLHVTTYTVYRHFREGRLPGFKVGKAVRFRRAELDRWMAEQEARAAVPTARVVGER